MKKTLLWMALMLSVAVATGCAKPKPYYDDAGYQRGGPPPHAPAHGYRHKHQRYDMRYDSSLGVYVLLDLLDHYYVDDRYFRYHDNDWQYTRDLDSNRWRDADRKNIPEQLYQRYSDGNSQRGKGRGRGKSKGRGNGNN